MIGFRLFPILAFGLLLASCNGGGGSGETPTPSDTGTPASQPSPTATGEPSPTPTEDRTPSAAESPTATPIPVGTPSLTPIASPAASVEVECELDPDGSGANCPGEGSYSIDPPLTPNYTDCSLSTIGGQPAVLICTGGDQTQTVYLPVPLP
jgi:hypothetical protein